MYKKWQCLKKRLREIYDLESVIAVLTWDQNTHMPPGGAEARGKQLSVLGELAHQKKTAPELGELLEAVESEPPFLSYDSDQASIVRVAKRQYLEAQKVSTGFISRFYEHIAKTNQIWMEARESNDFGKVAPCLEKTLDLSREYASFFPESEHIADPLINRSDYGMKASDIQELFHQLRRQLVPFVDEITQQPASDRSCLLQAYPVQKQLDFCKEVIAKMGFDFRRGRLDLAMHPFMIGFAAGDIRITTRVKEQDLSEVLFSTIHEAGHAIYEMGINPAYEGTPLHNGISCGVHESQSRLWENIIGRSREFWSYFYPKLQARFPSQLGNVSLDDFYRAINHVERSLIRTDADELTYNLHVIIRFDLELALLEGKLQIRDLPEAWNERYKTDLGLVPPNDRDGVLQDIHWYFDFIGGVFQGYTLGNILSSQFYQAALKACPEIPEQIVHGNFVPLHAWLKENIYQHGSKYTAAEIVERATGSSLAIEPYMEYLRKKYYNLYLSR
ncbi:carboxypeptidase M32 [Thermoactinomyces mirandus]|uniref:carboxypeptidase M32 n=1 Tax=Thermoactinomyces mirandus TaxID=2756294 RepID=UPI001C68F6EF|nr:carboxypeptidase M32 [Thermoactinomyces mirandus]